MTVTVGNFARFQADWRARRRAELAAIVALRRMRPRRPLIIDLDLVAGGRAALAFIRGGDRHVRRDSIDALRYALDAVAPPRVVQPPIGSAMRPNTRPGGWTRWQPPRGWRP